MFGKSIAAIATLSMKSEITIDLNKTGIQYVIFGYVYAMKDKGFSTKGAVKFFLEEKRIKHTRHDVNRLVTAYEKYMAEEFI
ncbi:MAG: hypothetical protein ACO1OF_16335 [Adhaeribacter sp.]